MQLTSVPAINLHLQPTTNREPNMAGEQWTELSRLNCPGALSYGGYQAIKFSKRFQVVNCGAIPLLRLPYWKTNLS